MNADHRTTIDDLQALSSRDLEDLSGSLFDGVSQAGAVPAPFHFVLGPPGDRTGVFVKRALPRRPALEGVVLPALARAAREAEFEKVVVVTTGVIDADAWPHLDLALEKLKAATGVDVQILDGEDLLARIAQDAEVRARFFPRAEEADSVAAASHVSTGLVKAATAIATRAPETPLRRGITPYVRLGWAVAVIAAVIAIPIPVGPSEARCVAIIGLAVLIVSFASGAVASNVFGPTLDRFGGLLLEQLLPLPDRTSLLRRINIGSPGTLMLLVLVGFMAVLRLLRLFLVSGVLGFVAFFSLGYLLLWSIEPARCTSLATACHGAFVGAGARPSVGDFVYLATQSAFFNQPAGLTVFSRAAHAIVSAEFVVAAVLLVGLAASIGFPSGIWSNVRTARSERSQ